MQKRSFLLTALAAVMMAGVVMVSCDKEEDAANDSTKQGKSGSDTAAANVEVKIVGTQVANIGETHATLLCRFTKADGSDFTQAEIETLMNLNPQGGFCLVEGEGTPTIKDSTINCIETARQGGIMSGTFNSLKQGTKYTVRAWLTVDGTTINYGENVTFTTQGSSIALSLVATQAANVSDTYATVLCRLAKANGTALTQEELAEVMKQNPQGGFCLVEGETMPTVQNPVFNCIETARQGGVMSGTFNNLKQGTKYSVRAWLTINGSTLYGDKVTFTTNNSGGGSTTISGIEMVLVNGGTFTMGGTSEQGSDAYDWEKPTIA